MIFLIKSAEIFGELKGKLYLCNPNSEKLHAKPLETEWIDSLAQLVEHNTFNVGVLGSSPKRITG